MVLLEEREVYEMYNKFDAYIENKMIQAVHKAFMERKTEGKREEKKKTLYNTRKLMESYIELKKYTNDAIAEEKSERVTLNCVKESKVATTMMIHNIDRAMQELESENRQESTLYKYEAFKMHYIDGFTFEQIAEKLNCGKNSPAIWNKAMLKRMSVKLFGINGIWEG